MGSRRTYQIVDDDGVPHAECTARDVLSVLADPRRRVVVKTVHAHETNWIDVDTLVADVHAAVDALSPNGWRRELRHRHLPMLDDVGLIDYDATSDAVRRYDCELVSDVLDALEIAPKGGARETTDV